MYLADLKQTYAFYSFKLEITQRILNLSKYQWKTFMTDYHKWMGNVVIEDGLIRPFINKMPLALVLYVKSAMGAQHARFYSQSMA